ncbi:MAG: patatin family protein [Oscillospiraceae bacterium]|nr:patatin family protein [Oscillospiraceae bacterium]
MDLGLVLEGGAHRTIFSSGVTDALLDAGIMADYVIGSSAGITYGLSYVSGQKGRNREMLRRFVRSSSYMGMHHLLNPMNRSYYNLKYVFETIPNELLPYKYAALQRFQGKVIAAVTNLETGEAEYLDVSRTDRTWQVLRATCALPLMFRPIEIDGQLYADGGIADSIPFRKAIEDGCNKTIVVLTRERSYRKNEESLMHVAVNKYRKKYPAYAEQLETRHLRYNVCVSELEDLETAGEVYVIAPEDTLGVGRTEKCVDKLMALYAQGYALTMQQMPAIRAYLEE